MKLGVAFGAFVGLLGLVRQDAGLIAQASVATFALITWVFNKLPGYSTKQGKRLIVMLCFLAASFIPMVVFHAHIALSGVEVRGNLEHGIWHNVYLGFGFTPNPYGIRWDDTVGAAHARANGAEFGTPEYQPMMRKLVFSILLKDPVFVLKSVVRRFAGEVWLIGGLAYAQIGWLAAGLALWPLVLLTRNGWVYGVVVAVALLPPVLTWPSPQYSLGVAMGLLASGLFAVGSLIEGRDRNESR